MDQGRSVSRLVCRIVAALACCGVPAIATGQDLPRVEVDGGYRFAVIRHEFNWQNYQGWAIEEATYVRPRLAIAVAVDGLYRNWTDPNTGHASESNRRYGLLAGVKVTGSRDRTVVPFGQMLVGIADTRTTLRVVSVPEIAVSASGFAIQPGGGVDVRVTDAFWVQASFDVRVDQPQYSTSWGYPEWRMGAAITYHLRR